MTTDLDNENLALTTAEKLRTIATNWRHMMNRLANDGTATGNERITTSQQHPLPIRSNISDLGREINTWVTHLTTTLDPNDGWQAPTPYRADTILTRIADHHIGHFIPGRTAEERYAFLDDVERFSRRTHAAAFPRHIRNVTVPRRPSDPHSPPMPCAEITPVGPCEGHYQIKIDSDTEAQISTADITTWPGLHCSANHEHHVSGRELALAGQYIQTRRLFNESADIWDELVRGRREDTPTQRVDSALQR